MRRWIYSACILFTAIACLGKEDALGPVDFALNEKEKTSVKQYYDVNSGGQSILKIYENGSWRDVKPDDLGKNAYVISHGLNDTYGSGWITQSAAAIAKENPNAVIISVNWDHYSGTESNIKDSNFGASSWINSVSPILAKELNEFTNIKSFVGHSYGAHLLADTMVQMYGDGKGKSSVSFVALDPAEETLTYTGTQKDGSPTTMWSDNKKSKDWRLPDNVTSEVYKSSGFLGSEERLGDYNYFLAAEGSITPRGVLGDLDSGNKKMDYSSLGEKEKEKGVTNHSLAPAWFAEMMTTGHFDGDFIGGWFNSDVEGDLATRKDRNREDKEWDGVVNATSSVKNDNPTLEYNATTDKDKAGPVKTWQDLCNAEAQELLHHDLNGNSKDDKSNWNETVLNPSKYDGYKRFHGNDNPQTTTDAKVDQNNENVSNTRLTTQNDGGNVTTQNDSGNGIDGDAPANILNATFADDPAEPKDAQTLANAAFDKEIEKIVKDVADGDESLAQKIKDFVKDKIDEAIKKGEEWVEDGGIRRTILEQVDKMVDGKVSPEDAQRIHNLVDTLCNVNKDGGESFCNTLGTDGKDLAVSLAVEALKKQLSDALPADVADRVNALLDVLKENGTAEDYKKVVIGQLQDLIAEYVPYENTANTLNGILQNIADGNAIDVMDSIKDVGKNLGIDLLKDAITKNLDPELAAKINALLDGFAANGIQGLTDEALAQINALIDKYAPGSDSAQKIKDIIKGTLDGTVKASDFRDAVTSIVTDGARKLIEESGLPDPVKEAAIEALDGLTEGGIDGLTQNIKDYIQGIVTDNLGEEAGDAIGQIFDGVVKGDEDAWDKMGENLEIVGKAIGQKVLKWAEDKVAKQIDKLIAKNPFLKELCGRLGINGKGVIQGIKNVLNVLINAKDLKEAFTKLSQMAVNFLKDVISNLIDIGLEKLVNWAISHLVPKVVDWAQKTLQGWADSANNPLVKKGLEWLANQVGNCKKCASARIKVSGVGDKLMKWMDKKMNGNKNGPTKTVLEN